MFITFEGIEGTGKSTQITLLKNKLLTQNRAILTTKEPGGSRLGKELRSMLLNVDADITPEAELFLYLADRSQHMAQVILPALKDKKIVISDRFADSTIVYQGYGRGLPVKMLQELNNLAVSNKWPDITFLLDMAPEKGLERAIARNEQEGKDKTEGRFEAESIAFHNRIREGYLSWAELHPKRFILINADRQQDEVHKEIWDTVQKLISQM